MSTIINWKYEKAREEEETTVMNTEKARHDKKEAAEEIFDAIETYEFVATSPNDGSFISVVRLADVLRAICSYYGLDPKETRFSDYNC